VISRPIHRILGTAFFGSVALMALGGAGTVLHVHSPLARFLGTGLAVCLALLFGAGSLLFLVFPFREGVRRLKNGSADLFATWCAGGVDEIDGTGPGAGEKVGGVLVFVLYAALSWIVVAWAAWQLGALLH
jgi:hypothetical protein